jgi:hypothetical protein
MNKIKVISTDSINNIISQTLYLVSGATSSTGSATSANLQTFQYIVPNLVAFYVSGTSGTSASNYIVKYNIYSGVNSTLSNIASGSISNTTNIDSSLIINAMGISSFAADLTVSGTLSGSKIYIIAKNS